MFWDKFKDHLDEVASLHRNELKQINERIGLKEAKSFLKHLSYFGAIEIPKTSAIPDRHVAYVLILENGERIRYIDPLNVRYAEVFRCIWPESLTHITNVETLGDVVEAFLGYHWALKWRKQHQFQPIIEDIVSVLSRAILACWTLDLAFPEWRNRQ